MEESAHENAIDISYKHWWYLARNEIIESLIKKNSIKKDLKILDVGCGTGSNLNMLKKFGKVSAFEPFELVCEHAKSFHSDCDIRQGSLPVENPFQNEKFDIITALDVIEHIEDDVYALKEIKNIMSDNGLFILTVPAIQHLYDSLDEHAHHFRRYSKRDLRKKLISSGFSDFKIYYFNSFLFLPIYLIRMILKILKIESVDELKLPNKFVNNFLYNLFKLEKYCIKFNPIGISLCAIIKK